MQRRSLSHGRMAKNRGGSRVKGKMSLVTRRAAKFIKTQHFSAPGARGTTMTINDLWNDLLRNIKQINYIFLTEASGETWAVDISVLLHQFCKLNDVVLALNSEPLYAPVSLLNALKNWHSGLTSSGITPFYVFDGYLSHPMKAVMHEVRKRTVDKAKEELEEFYQKGRDGEPIGED